MSRGDVVDVWIGPPEIQRWRQSSKCSKWSYRSSALGANFVNDSENELRDRRGARSAMRCYEISCVKKLERRAVARDLVCDRDQISRRIGESWSVQHLANVTRCLRTFGVMVQERDT